jgi:hypothetical protein
MFLSVRRSVSALFCIGILTVAAARPSATSYLAVTFEELVAKADMIFVGDVLDVRPFVDSSPEGSVIKTRVTFVVRDGLWGTTSTLEILEFFGGEVGDVGMRIAEMPTFRPGDRRLVFASRERSINPIVGFTQGLMRLTPDATGADVMETASGQALTGTNDVGRPRALGARPARGMTYSALRLRIVDRLRERQR